jgi:HK97 family phage major capsid protein
VSGRDDWEHEDERPIGVRPIGVRPIGVRPIGVRPIGVRPIGVRDEDERPIGVRPIGVRPIGVRPIGVRPFGVRPFGVRPIGVRETSGYLDPEEWAADICDLLVERSAVIRLGATVVADEYELRAHAVDATAAAPAYLEEGREKPLLEHDERTLRPRDHELAAKVVLPDRVARDLAEDPLLALAVKEDLAEALALRADEAFLSGAAPAPVGIVTLAPGSNAGPSILETARAMLTTVRTVDPSLNPPFRAPGWIVHPATLDALSQEPIATPTVGQATVDMVLNLLSSDGADGGRLLGYPLLVTTAALDGNARRLFFSADWREAWIGVDGAIVNVDISRESHFQSDETVIRVAMVHDFTLRRPDAFTWSGERAGRARRRKSS